MSGFIEKLLVKGNVIPLGARRITRTGPSHERYHVYLPEGLNDLWRVIWSRRMKVNIYIEIPAELQQEQKREDSEE